MLVANKIVTGLRGKGGGYRLAREPEQINVGDILNYMEGGLAPVSCLDSDREPCSRASDCRTLEFWKGLDEVIRRYTSSYTVADFVSQKHTENS